MIRKNDLARKIAYKLLGEPDNMKDKKSAQQKEVDHRLLFEKTQRVR